MKKYYPVDFDEKGNVILGKEKNTPTSNGFIPTAWVPGGGSEDEGNGIKSITITPALETTPTLDSLFPIYWDEAQAEEGWQYIRPVLKSATTLTDGTKYTVTVTPTPGWFAGNEDNHSEMGQPFTYEATVSKGVLHIDTWVGTDDESYGISIILTVTGDK